MGPQQDFFRVKDTLEEDTDCKMSYQREEPVQTTIYARDSHCLPDCQRPPRCPSSLPGAAPSCRRDMGLAKEQREGSESCVLGLKVSCNKIFL